MNPASSSKGAPWSKRSLDLLLTVPGVILLSPLYLLIALAVLVIDGPPVFFRQLRPGFRGKPFRMLKFRSMRVTEEPVSSSEDMQRTSRFGHLLRRTSLDELPELFNVLKGEMSLVGPRPLLMEYLERYSPEQSRRHDVLPGITGWAQIHGRNALSWEEKFTYDVWYVDHWSFGLDLRILWMTVAKVFKREGINQSAGTTMPEFTGRKPR